MSPYLRKVNTASEAVAVQIVAKIHGASDRGVPGRPT